MFLMSYIIFFFFFFSSRRRHTRSTRDWSSDVCSSDLSGNRGAQSAVSSPGRGTRWTSVPRRSEEHTSELQSRVDLVCRLLLEKKKKKKRDKKETKKCEKKIVEKKNESTHRQRKRYIDH